MLIGEFTTQLGEKNRVAIPKRLRDQLQGNIYLAKGYERSLILLDQTRWNTLVAEINKNSILQTEVRDSKRFILGSAFQIDPDNQGRFVIPENLIQFANLVNKITFVGVGEWIEIWEEDQWNLRVNELTNSITSISDRLAKRI